ncbi:MAG: glycosyltransferase family 4 protein [Thermoplasmata archaeon]|nr:MAG: glycosyltransferase family 4 protein [Thermoplasmata archaeon]
MNIMLQNHTFYPILGGIENYLYHVSKTFIKKGHQPVILCEKHDDRLSSYETYDGIRIIRHPYYRIPKRMLFTKPKIVFQHLKSFISEHVGDIDFVISRYPHYCSATCSLNIDIPVFYIPPSVHWKQLRAASSRSTLKARFFNFLWKKSIDRMEKLSVLKSNKTVVFSKNMAESLQQYSGLEGHHFYVLPPGVDLVRFNRAKDYQLLRELDISPKSHVLLYVGRLSPEKNVETLIEEFRLLGREDLNLIIVGYGFDKQRLERTRAVTEGGERIRFLGRRTDVERFYSIADVFISPSKHEPFGQVILEAMAAGLPCIAFKRVPPEYEVAAEEMIESGLTGYCVNPYDRNELRERLLYLIDHPNIGKKMGEAGRRVCEKKFSWDNHVRKLFDLMAVP